MSPQISSNKRNFHCNTSRTLSNRWRRIHDSHKNDISSIPRISRFSLYLFDSPSISALLLFSLTGFGILLKNEEVLNNWKLFTNQKIDYPTFSQFYDVGLFEDIKNFLGTDKITKYNFLSIGLYPSIAQYNGLKTLDSYQNNYPLKYKHEFRNIIKNELAKDSVLKHYFDDYGSRCYAFTSTTGAYYMYGKNAKKEISKLDFDLTQFRNMNGKYILSALPIKTDSIKGLIFLNSFSSLRSYWKLYLYEVEGI